MNLSSQPEEQPTSLISQALSEPLSSLWLPEEVESTRSSAAVSEVFREFLRQHAQQGSLSTTAKVAIPQLNESARREALTLAEIIGTFFGNLREPIFYARDCLEPESSNLWRGEEKELAWKVLRDSVDREICSNRGTSSENTSLIPSYLVKPLVDKVCELASTTVAAVEAAGLEIKGFEFSFSFIPRGIALRTPHPIWHNHRKVIDERGGYAREDTSSLDITASMVLYGPSSVIGEPRSSNVLNAIPDFIDLRMQSSQQRPGLGTDFFERAAQLYDLEGAGLLVPWSPPLYHPVMFGCLAPHRAPNAVDPRLFTIDDRAEAINAIARQLMIPRVPSRTLVVVTVIVAKDSIKESEA